MNKIPQEIKRKISGIKNIATLPNIAAEIIDLTRRSDTNMNEIAKLIEKDASIITKIIKVSNSPLWGFSGRIDNIRRALILLGLKEVTNIVIAISLYSTFIRLKPNPLFDRDQFWLHSSGTGQIARALAKKLKLNFHGQEFVASLIHDLGKLILDQFFSQEFEEILKASRQNGKLILEIEKEVLGCTHSDLAGWVLQKWNFPESIINSVIYHHHPENAGDSKELASIIYLADNLCEMWGIGFDDDIKKFNLNENSAWEILKSNNSNLADLDMERFAFELHEEIAKAQLFIELIRK